MLVMGTWAWNTWESFLDFLASLEPIYTFVACGACVGVIAGVSLGVTSSFITSLFGMHRQSYRIPPPTPAPSTPSSERPGTGKTEDSSSYETDWQMLNKPPPKRRRRTPGLWSQTIHEEDDDDSGGF
ncbi:hypothetical protein Cob_v004630 [Colletotrichum orbiculare MAFF 240422]|uniref:Uncharacterized protein n=3 Tax=Colletotrichum orbiculare species complex TaxID=2707354 RepID=A0A484FX44_COLOR|nr:hypothetical protein Cob_v004630 [Colletotrichum orbiculare MAFF 240422]TDZ30951.1 hypothetical protein C8035_v001825 [Colletotrichum spinosum]TDZ51618.1 hypothetical protein CTRI78_v007520 [Colletotrichum trifolii]